MNPEVNEPLCRVDDQSSQKSEETTTAVQRKPDVYSPTKYQESTLKGAKEFICQVIFKRFSSFCLGQEVEPRAGSQLLSLWEKNSQNSLQ